MKNWILLALVLATLALAAWAGHHVAALAGERDLAAAQADWAKERAGIADARATAEAAQRRAEQGQARAIHEAAESYQQGKADAEATSATTVADLRSGALRLREQWATCRATSAAVSSAAVGQQPDDRADDRAASAGRIVRAAAECDAQVRGLQKALSGERAAQ